MPESYTEIPAKRFFGLLVLDLAFAIPLSILLDWLGASQFESIMEDLLTNNKLLVIISGIIIAPLIEEPIFRLHIDLKKSSIWWSLVLSVLVFGGQWFLLVAFITYMIYLLITVSQNGVPNTKFVIFTSAAFFGVVHIGNYSNFDFGSHFYWIPFLVGAQFFGGLILSYIRLNHGIGNAMLFHGAYNAILIIPGVYFYET